jgi:hypothetical protein
MKRRQSLALGATGIRVVPLSMHDEADAIENMQRPRATSFRPSRLKGCWQRSGGKESGTQKDTA